jgi:FAD-dependent urate hydroxylase
VLVVQRPAETGGEWKNLGTSEDYDIFILDAEHRQTLACARSLGRAGLRVALGESLSLHDPDLPLPSFRSRHCARSIVLPGYSAGPLPYAEAVLEFAREHPTRVILPASDVSCAALMPHRQRFAELGTVLAMPSDSALEIAFDKNRTLQVAREHGIAHPKLIRVGSMEELSVPIAEFGFPFVLKPTVSWAEQANARVVPVEVVDKGEAAEVAERFFAAGSSILAQPWVPGRRESLTLFIVGGEVLASCAHVEHRTTPPLGGASVLRESIAPPPDSYDAAVRLATAIGIEGLCEIEFRRDAAGLPLLMEINARLVGTIDNSIKSGVNFPLLIWQWATGEPVAPVAGYRAGVRSRWLHGDLRWLVANQGRAGRPDSVSRGMAIWEFTTEFFRTRHYDYLDLRDMRPVIAALGYTGSVIRKSLRQPSRSLSIVAVFIYTRGMEMAATGVLIIGAGPFGLSVSAHLRSHGIEHLIVGTPMDAWREHSPVGMFLKSEPYGSDFASPQRGYDVAAYSKQHGLDYVHRLGPLSLERFLTYADWFAAQLVPDVRDDRVTEITRTDGGFRVAFAGAESVLARQVVIATGVRPYAQIPAELSGLPADLVTHTSDHHRLDRFSGREVAVLGAGQSALETAALLHEQGAGVHIIARVPELFWNARNPEHVSPIGYIKKPVNKLCEGWRCTFYNTPAAFRLLPRDLQAAKARSFLGPAGAWWLKKRVAGVVDTMTGYQVRKADPSGSGIRLFLDGPQETALDVDHVIAGTGFRVDLARLAFLPADLRSQVATFKGYPVVSRIGESSVPNLYFAGAHTAANLGPSVRFIAGTHNVSRLLANSLARRAGKA